MILDAPNFLRTPPGEAARRALEVRGYGQRQLQSDVSIAYRDDGVLRVQLGAIGYTSDGCRIEDAAIVVHPVNRLNECIKTVTALAGVPAPFFLLHDQEKAGFRLWIAATAKGQPRTPVEVIREVISPDRLDDALRDFGRDLRPETVSDVRLGRAKFEAEAFRKLDPLQLLLLSEAANEKTIVSHFGHALDSMRHGAFTENRAGELALQLLAWRVLTDRNKLPNSTDIDEILPAAKKEGLESYFNWSRKESSQSPFKQAAELMCGLTFTGFEVDMLRAIYQRTFNSQQTKELGRFDTPLWLTRRILAHLPLETLAPNNRHIADMTCGWGSFLVASYERLKAMPDVRRPRSLVRQIHGNEYDSLTAGLARLALLLVSDHNTWAVSHGDAFDWDLLKPNSLATVVGNPPFLTKTGSASRSDYAYGFLEKAIDSVAPSGYIGMVMPASFEVKQAGGPMREKLLKECDIYDLWRLPGDVFKGTKERVTVVIAQKKKGGASPVRVQETASGAEERQLLRRGCPSASSFVANARAWSSNEVKTPGRAPSTAVFSAYALLAKDEWSKLASRTLEDVAYIIYGLPEGSKSRARAQDAVKSTDAWYLKTNDRAVVPFKLNTSKRRLIRFPDDLEEPGLGKRNGQPCKYELMLQPKAVAPATLRQDWGQILVSAVDRSKTLFSNTFWCFVPTPSAIDEGITAEVLSAILNWWVANGWIAEYRHFPAPQAAVWKTIPFPPTANKKTWEAITKIVRSIEIADDTQREALLEALDGLLVLAYKINLDDVPTQRLKTVFNWKKLRGTQPTLDRAVPAGKELIPVTGTVRSLAIADGKFTLWLDHLDSEIVLPLTPCVPGWMLRGSCAFLAMAVLDGKNNIIELCDYRPEPFAYLTDDELNAATHYQGAKSL